MKRKVIWYIFILGFFILTACSPTAQETVTQTSLTQESSIYTEARQALTEKAIELQGLENEDVIEALRTVPRHQFVPNDLIDLAYEDTALPIGYGQTISQPSLVAYMTELLELEPGDKVLEIGTGSGYQAAMLAELGYVDVYSIEIVPELYERASQTLKALGYTEVHTKQGDGYYGWEEAAPFDAIVVTAAPDHLPGPLAEQLSEGGVMVIPIGPQGFYQTLWKFIKEEGELVAYNMGNVVFVPFTGEAGEVPGPSPEP
ncbi:MAG: protein-L-isoaspartate(D-aspartate) O-methyltransferase [Anaerolineales bacterium]